jgi:hypothetical protein
VRLPRTAFFRPAEIMCEYCAGFCCYDRLDGVSSGGGHEALQAHDSKRFFIFGLRFCACPGVKAIILANKVVI